MSGEKLSIEEAGVSEFIQKLNVNITELGLTPEHHYNTDETGLNWRQLPIKMLVTQEEKHVSGRKLQKEWITLMVCANAPGVHILKLLVVRKSKSPCALKNIRVESLPFTYMSYIRARVTKEVFHDWYTNSFVPQVKQHWNEKKLPVKALILLDNAPGHPDKEELRVRQLMAI
ncbi:hypothetical protein PR048_004863 [Dryococelus australis]|uniref:DDE-1 domain-containing protein n=1 Tax=Dryococelus australis TaxID=614101 RepID=A0ABQ9I8P1_9NEOP|nr:hypothetical protein PR048_004863 [Dryococelus australis]